MTATDTTTAAARFLADAAKRGVTLDSYNRYVLPDPGTGKDRAWTRATTWAGAVKETFALDRWSRRMEAHGFAMRADLLATVAADVSSYGPGNFTERDCSRLDEAITQAQGHAGSTVAATFGTVMHRFTELLDESGEMPETVPAPLDRDLAAYRATMTAHGFESVAIERIVCVPDLGVAGTLDRVLSRGGAYIGDLKTGANLGYSWGEIAIQLALYAHAAFIWNGDGWDPMGPVDQERAVVMHLPIGSGDCTLYWVDIAAGWDVATTLCGPVRAWRTRRDLATRIKLSPPSPPVLGSPERAASADDPAPDVSPSPPTSAGRVAQTRSEWVSARLAALAANPRARSLVGLRWPADTSPQPPWPDETIDQLATMLDGVEDEVQATWSTPDPRDAQNAAPEAPESPPERRSDVPAWDVPDDGQIVPDDDVKALSAVLAFLDEAQQERLLGWAQDATRVGRPFAGRTLTRRMLTCAHAAFALAAQLPGNDQVRIALEQVVGPLDAAWTVGAVIGSLSVEQAETIIDAWNNGDSS